MSLPSPPRWAAWCMRKLLPPDPLDLSLGDLDEVYADLVEHEGVWSARGWYIRQLLSAFFPFLRHVFYWSIHMLRNYTKIAVRHFLKDRRNTALNVLGLVIGLASFLVIYRFVFHELSYDHFHENADQIYRITTAIPRGDQTMNWAVTHGYLNVVLEEQVPEVEHVTKMIGTWNDFVFMIDDQPFQVPEKTGLFTDSDFFRVFDFKLQQGDPETALSQPNQIVVTEDFAQRYFKTTDVMGRTITEIVDGESDDVWTVSGVLAPIPKTSHLQFDFLISGMTSASFWTQTDELIDNGFQFHIFFRAAPNVDETNLRASIADVTDRTFAALGTYEFPVQRITDIYFNANNLFEMTDGGNYNFVQLLMIVGLLMIVVSSINYITLSTSQSLRRAKEIGIRKTLGSTRSGLIIQILIEASLLGIFAALIAFNVAETVLQKALPAWFDLQLSLLDVPILLVILFGVAVGIGVVSGIFLAYKISALNTVDTLRGKLEMAHERVFSARNGLVTLQFVITAVLIVASLVIFRQIDYLKNKDLGYTKDYVVTIRSARGTDQDRFLNFKERIAQESQVAGVGSTVFTFISDYNSTFVRVLDPALGDTFSTRVLWNAIDDALLPTLDMPLVAGRNFSRDLPTDQRAVIINEAAQRALGLDDPLGKQALAFMLPDGGEIVGVVKDYHYQSFNQSIKPTFFVYQPRSARNLLVRLQTENLSRSLGLLEQRWRESGIVTPFEYTFLEDRVAALMEQETRLSTLVTLFTILLVFVAGLGLVGLVSYTTERRKKEIGVRKVFGASVPDILLRINKQFMILIGVALILGMPLAWWAVSAWLENFAYRIALSPIDFLLAGLVMGLLAVLTTTLRALGTARLNPVEVLKRE